MRHSLTSLQLESPDSHPKQSPNVAVAIRVLAALVGLSISVLPTIVVWDYGGVLPWTKFWISLVACLLFVVSLPILIAKPAVQSMKRLFFPVICVAIWVIAYGQTVPINETTLRTLSSGSYSAHTQWVPDSARKRVLTSTIDIPKTGDDVSQREPPTKNAREQAFPVSVCPTLTRRAMALPAIIGLIAFISAFVFTDKRHVLMLLAITSVSGGVLSTIGIFEIIRAPAPPVSTDLLTKHDLGETAAWFGPFLNKNNAACYLNVSLACNVGLIIFAALSAKGNAPHKDERYAIEAESFFDRVTTPAQEFVRILNAGIVFWILLGIIQFAGILASSSRGGMVAALVGGAVCLCATWQSRKARFMSAMIAVILVLFSLFALESVNLSEQAGERIGSIFSTADGSQVGRIAHWQDSLRAARHYFPVGSGLGTYRFAYLPTHQYSMPGWFVNADSMPFEWLVEGGVWLAALVILTLLCFLRGTARLRRLGKSAHEKALVATGWFMATSLVVSNCFDFGILLPSIYLTIAALVGAMSANLCKASATTHEKASHLLRGTHFQRSCVAGLACILIVIGFCTVKWSLLEAKSDVIVRVRPITGISMDEFEAVFARDTELINTDPWVMITLARQLIVGQRESAMAAAKDSLHPSQLDLYRALTDIECRRAAFYEVSNSESGQFASNGATVAMLRGQNIEAFEIAHDLAARALVLCPFSVEARDVMLQTSFVAAEDTELSERLIDHVIALWPKNTAAVQQLAQYAVAHPGWDTAAPLFARVLNAEPSRFSKLWPYIELQSDIEQQSLAFPDNPSVLMDIASKEQIPDQLADELLARASRLLAVDSLDQDSPSHTFLRARLAFIKEDLQRAEEFASEAVHQDPSTIQYRVFYAELLELRGKTDLAMKQLRRCTIQAPDDHRARALQQRLQERRFAVD